MLHSRLLLMLVFASAAALTACATPEPELIADGTPVPEPSQQKCATVTGSRIASTCSNLVKSTTNKAAVAEAQRHRSLGGGGDNGWGSPTGIPPGGFGR